LIRAAKVSSPGELCRDEENFTTAHKVSAIAGALRRPRLYPSTTAMGFVIPHTASILLIDDEPDMLDEIASALAQTGYICRCCQESHSAAMLARQLRPDLIISDINLGDSNGLELCAQLRRIEGLAETPVIFLSGAQIPDIVKRSHAAGGTYYVRKPFDPEVLIELVDKALWMPHLARRRHSAGGAVI
jgi:DNA-binding response OmpR family regulator